MSQYLSRPQVAKKLNVHPETIKRWTKQGLIIPALKVKGRDMFNAADIEKALKAGAQ